MVAAGRMYFFKDDSYYLFSGSRLDVEDGYPRLINEQWSFCSEENLEFLTSAAPQHTASRYSSLLLPVIGLVSLLVLSAKLTFCTVSKK